MRADMSDKTRDSFIFYRSFFESTLPLNKEEKAELFDAICRYALDAEQINLQGFPQAMFSLIKPQLDANRKKWLNGCKEKTKSKEESIDEQEISKTEAKNKQTVSKPEGNVNVNDNVECKSQSESKLKIINKTIIPTFIDAELWNGFLEMRNKAKAKPTDLAIKGILQKLESFENKKQGWANESLRNSIESNWKGVFEPKQSFNKPQIADTYNQLKNEYATQRNDTGLLD
jgi:hypothetical protein